MNSYREALAIFEKRRDLLDDRVQSGIRQHRQGLAEFSFVDKGGNPVQHVHVKARQKTHDFKYGANLFMLDEFNSVEQNAAYREYFAKAFNMATLPFYWRDLEPVPGKLRFSKNSPRIYRRPPPDLCLEFCEANGIEPKAHCLNYCCFMPPWAQGGISKEKQLLDKRFGECAARYADRIRDWEVVNEVYCDWRRKDLGRLYFEDDFVEWNFKTADRYFPQNRLIINEWPGAIWPDNMFFGTRSMYYMLVERALRNGARIDSIGMQYHMYFKLAEMAKIHEYYDPQRVYDILDCYAKLGRNIQITELSIPSYSSDSDDEEVQAELLRHIYSIWFSHPAMEAILYWNVVDGFAAYAPQGDMTAGENVYRSGFIRYDFTEKPMYRMLCNLFGKEWRTNLEVDSGERSTAAFRGFYGNYQLEITANGKTFEQEIHLTKNHPADWVIRIPGA